MDRLHHLGYDADPLAQTLPRHRMTGRPVSATACRVARYHASGGDVLYVAVLQPRPPRSRDEIDGGFLINREV